jgi:hypothetical protein
MKLTFFILFAFNFMISCEPKQWNLNKSLGWESNHEVKLLYVKGDIPDTTGYATTKNELDTKIAAKLEAAHLGESAEDDATGQTDALFVVPKQYEKALEIIIRETRSFGRIKKFQVYEREYISETKWDDKQIYSE